MKLMEAPIYPFAAIIGQENLRLGLLLAAVNPRIGGLLARGEKGTAKSTLARGLAALLPEIGVTEGCPFCCAPEDQGQCPHCGSTEDVKGTGAPAGGLTPPVACGDSPFKGRWREAPKGVSRRRAPLVNLPLNATEDRLAGGLDFTKSLAEGRPVLAPGLLAAAHQGLLYVDEVNLLDDHLVDLILDAAASGVNRVEREGLSFSHPARFTLVGTMNPEEGELRPQLLDRFGLCVDVKASDDPEERVRLMEAREAFDANPVTFFARYQEENAVLAEQIQRGRELLPLVRMNAAITRFIAELCRENHCAGHRAELVLDQAVRALAALEGRTSVTLADVQRLAPFVLLHRRRDAEPPPPPPPPEEPEEQPDQDEDRQDEAQEQEERQEPENPGQEPEKASGKGQDAGEQNTPAPTESGEKDGDQSPASSSAPEDQVFAIGQVFAVKPIQTPKDRILRRGSGRRSRTRIAQKKGRYVKSSLRFNEDLALDATLRAAAPHQLARRQTGGTDSAHLALLLNKEDLRGKIREKRIGNLLLFVVDASGSMAARGRMAATKGAIMSLLLDAYKKRDQVALISFRRKEAALNLPPTISVDLAGKLLAEMPVGGRTPLSAALARCHQELRNYTVKNPGARPIVILLSDGRSNVNLAGEVSQSAKPLDEALLLARTLVQTCPTACFIVVDTEEAGLISFGLARKLAAALEARYFRIDELEAETLVKLVKEQTT